MLHGVYVVAWVCVSGGSAFLLSNFFLCVNNVLIFVFLNGCVRLEVRVIFVCCCVLEWSARE